MKFGYNHDKKFDSGSSWCIFTNIDDKVMPDWLSDLLFDGRLIINHDESITIQNYQAKPAVVKEGDVIINHSYGLISLFSVITVSELNERIDTTYSL